MPTNKTDKKKAAPDPRIERAVKLPRVIKKELNDIKAVLGGMNNELRFLNEWKHEVTKKLNGSQEVDAIKEEKGKWVPKENDYVVSGEEVLKVFAVFDVDRFGHEPYARLHKGDGYTDRYVRELRPASSEEIEACAYGEREGLEDGMWCACTLGEGEDIQRVLLASDGNWSVSYTKPLEDHVQFVQWAGNYLTMGAPLQYFHSEPVGTRISVQLFKKLLIKTIEKLRSAREEEEAKKRKEEEHRPIKELRNDIVRIKTLLVDKQMYSVAMKMRDVERHLLESYPEVFEPSNP